MRKWCSLTFFLAISIQMLAQAQTANEQIWAEYTINYSFANSYKLENGFRYSTSNNDSKWRNYAYIPAITWSATPFFDANFRLYIAYTNQTTSDNTFEIRPTIGTQFNITPNRRIQTKLLIRLEQRNLKDLETKEWEQVLRPRLRAQVIVPVTQDSYFKDKLWYAITDFELLYNVSDVDEKFANRFRIRIGAGYRLNYSLRFEFLYMLQESKDTIDSGFDSQDNIFRFRVKHYLRKSKPSQAHDVDS